jgi:tetrahydromethanopterin S-methyltransferase subunit F
LDAARKGKPMWKRNWWRETGRNRTSDYGGTVKMAIGALLAVVLVIILLRMVGAA